MWELVKNICRYVAALIDFVAYNVLDKVYNLFTELAQLSLYNERIMQILGKRIALVLGIFMLFRLAISLVTYLISPDKINDAGKGSKKLITNIIVSLVLLSTVNIIFKEAYVLQEKVVSSRIVEKVLFGNTYVGTQDPKLAYLVYGAFLQPNLKGCENIYYAYNNVSQECSIALNRQISEDIRKTIVDQIITQKNFGNVLKNYDTINATKTGTEEYVFDYTPIISTICAIIVILMILSFTLDLAVRIVKLLFFQIIAPIPIVSNMDPGKGAEIFKNWYKQCISTYVSVFIRIVAINFACFMIILLKTEFVEIFSGKSAFLTILLIIGCLMFAKQVPKLIEEIFGIKTDGMLLNPLKKFNEQALFGKQISGVATGALAGTAAGLKAAGANVISPGTGGRLFGAGAGFTSAFSRSLTSGLKGEKFGKIFSTSYGVAMDNKEKRVARAEDDVKFWEMSKNKIQRAVHNKTRGQRADELNTSLENYNKKGESIKNAIFANDKAKFRFIDSKGNNYDFNGAKGLKEFIDNMQGPVQGENENPEDFAKRQQEFIAYKNEFKDELDRQVSDITTGVRKINDGNRGASGGAAAQASVEKLLASMNEQLESINKEGTALYGNAFKKIDSATATSKNNMSLKNSLGGALGAQTTISSHAGHDRDIDKYGAKKDAK